MTSKIDRRTFIKSSAVGGLGLIAGAKGMGLIAPRSARAEHPVKYL